MGQPYIRETFKRIDCHNPISGHHWTEYGESTGFEVVGGGWLPTQHKTATGAEKELEFRTEYLKSHPECVLPLWKRYPGSFSTIRSRRNPDHVDNGDNQVQDYAPVEKVEYGKWEKE